MHKVGYAKLFSSITESSLWSEPKEVRLLFVTMLAKANSVGFVEASIPGLARVSNLPQCEVEAAIPILEGPDPFSKNPECDGRRILKAPGGWVVMNYEDYRNRTSEEERREYMREYMRDYRKACKQAVNKVKESKEKPYASASVSALKGKKSPEKKGKPDQAEIEAFCESVGLPKSDGEATFLKWEGNGWSNGGKSIKDWKATVRSWKLQGYMPSQKPQLSAGGKPVVKTKLDIEYEEHRRQSAERKANEQRAASA